MASAKFKEFFYILHSEKENILKKHIVLILLTCTAVFSGNDYDQIMISYLTNGLSKQKDIQNLVVKVVSKKPLHDQKNWSAYIMSISGKEVRGEHSRAFSRHSLYFTNGILVTPDLRNALTDERYKQTMGPKFDKHYYNDRYHLFGEKNAEHKVAIFSDPLCPYCIKYVPKVLNMLKQKPAKYSVYYYHMPLNMHPAAETLVKAFIALEQTNRKKADILKLYTVNISASEQNKEKILEAFNKLFDSHITTKDIESAKVLKYYRDSLAVSTDLMVNGTPTLFLDSHKTSIGRFLK